MSRHSPPPSSPGVNTVSTPILQNYRLASSQWLILYLRSGARPFVRRIRLGERDAGLFSYSDLDGLGLFARGRLNPGSGGHRPLRGELLVKCSSDQFAALAAQVWPVMREFAAAG